MCRDEYIESRFSSELITIVDTSYFNHRELVKVECLWNRNSANIN